MRAREVYFFVACAKETDALSIRIPLPYPERKSRVHCTLHTFISCRTHALARSHARTLVHTRERVLISLVVNASEGVHFGRLSQFLTFLTFSSDFSFFSLVFLVACTRLYKSLCRSVGPSVGRSVRRSVGHTLLLFRF